MSKNLLIKTSVGSAALVSSLLATTAVADQRRAEPALELLRKIDQNPAIAHSVEARNDALLTTGSIVKANGTDRVLYHLPAMDHGMRLSGESASKSWPVQIAKEQLEGTVTLRLAYKNAVSVMPEASHIGVEINGVMIGKRPIQSPDRSKGLRFPVPNHILVPGYNAVRIFTRQRHRVDCTIKATHELWTDIDASKTGFVFGRGNSALSSLDALSALARNKAGQVRMRVLTTSERGAAQVGRTMLLAQHTAIYADFDQAHVDVANDPGRGPGIDIFTGTRQELEAISPQYASAVGDVEGLQILSRNGDERLALILLSNDSTNAEADGAFAKRLKSMFPRVIAKGSAEGLNIARLQRSKGVAEGESIKFSELGLKSEEFDGRLYRRAFQVNLPSDYFAADYDQAEMHLATAYSAGLKSDNKFIIRVNGVTATGFSLGKGDGHVFKNKMLRLPLSGFRPGINSVEIEAQLAKPNEANCVPSAQISDNKRFIISGNSTIRFPRLAHLAKLPDLAGTVNAGFPYVIAGQAKPTVISVPSPGFDELSAAAGFATQVSVKSGVPLDFSLQYSAPPQSAQNAIVVGSFNELPGQIASTIKGIDQRAFQVSWSQPASGAENRSFASNTSTLNGIDPVTTAGIAPAKEAYQTHRAAPATSISRPAIDADGDILDRWTGLPDESAERQPDRLGFFDQVKGLFRSAAGLKGKGGGSTPVITNPNSDVLLSQQIAPQNERGVWTVLTARNKQALTNSVSMLVKPAIATQISGETVTVNGIDNTVTSSVVSQNYVQVRSFSLSNLHLIVAGWFSNNHLIYSLLLLCSLLGVGFASTRVVKTSGVKQGNEHGGNHA